MEQNSTLHFSWAGDKKGVKGISDAELGVVINGNELVSGADYKNDLTVDLPISGDSLDIEIRIGKKGSEKKGLYFKHNFMIIPGADYSARLEGRASAFTGLSLKLSQPNQDVTSSTPACKINVPVALLSFMFPIYGIYGAIKLPYNRNAAIGGAFIGFMLALIVSAMAPEGADVGIGFGKKPLVSYQPFSPLDILFNLLIGGIASLRGLLHLMVQ
ncbi:MAG: hypothetical protein HDS52_07560 [Barnesiella sp.]|nr:hypothetical protein [Barnesiella sp.]